jgi:hypothetical protein
VCPEASGRQGSGHPLACVSVLLFILCLVRAESDISMFLAVSAFSKNGLNQQELHFNIRYRLGGKQ